MATIRERKNQNGEIHYQAQVRLKGAPPQSATFKRKTDAKRWVQNTESAIREGRHFRTTQSQRHSLADLIDRYKKEILPSKPKSIKAQSRQLDWWKNELGYWTLGDVTPALISEARDKLHKGRQPGTVVRYMAALSHVFTIAVNEWELVSENPVSKVRKPKEPRGRVRFLSSDERKTLLGACKESSCDLLYPVVLLALSTGMRQMEVLNLRWADVDFVRSRVILHETKNDERRTVPLAGPAREEIAKLYDKRTPDSTLVFPSQIKPSVPIFIRKHWSIAVKAAKLDDFKFHDLRHTAASYLAMNGASLAEIADILGHKSLQMVKRYAHFSDSHTSKTIESMNENYLRD